MSIEEKNVMPLTVEEAALTLQKPSKQWYKPLRSPLWLCLLTALLVRAWLIYLTHGVIDGDEAMVGIQAEHILRGEHPIYFYGQAYMGSMEAYLTAILFAIAKPSVWALRAEPTLLSLLVVYLTWRLAAALAATAQLPPFATQMFKTIAALLAAAPPLYDVVLELRTLGGYIETFVLMLLLLLSAFQLTRQWGTGASKRELALRWAGIGLIVGLGFWINPLLVSAVLAAAIWIAIFCIAELVRLLKQARRGAPGKLRSFLQQCLLVLVALPACIVGATPALIWGYQNQWANFIYIQQLGDLKLLAPEIQKQYHNQFDLIRAQIGLYQGYVAPHVISGSLPTESSVLAVLHVFTLYLGLMCIAATLLLVVLSLFWRHPRLVRIRQLSALPLIFACCTAFTFCTSTITSAGLVSFRYDLAGRYATPLMLALPFFFATIFTLMYSAIHRPDQRRQLDGEKERSISLAPPHLSLLSRFRFPLFAQSILFVVLLLYLGVQVTSVGLTDPDTTYQSPSCSIAPAYNDTIIAYLRQEHVHYGWAVSWVGNPIIFKTNDDIILADPRPIISNQGLGRLPNYTLAVLHADHPSMLSLIRIQDKNPRLLRVLNARHITYHAKRFPAGPGFDVLVVTGLSHPVSLPGANELILPFLNCIVYT